MRTMIEAMRDHVDDGGNLSHENGLHLLGEVERLHALLNRPEIADFMVGVRFEAAHQVERWSTAHDAGKTPYDWFWLIGYLGQKAAHAAVTGDLDRAKHHTISTAAALANWHAQLAGGDNRMRPGIDPREVGEA